MIRAVLISLALVGCGPEIDRVERIGPHELSEERVSCTYPGYCFQCGVTIGMEMDCGLRFFVACAGTQRALVTRSKIRVHYKDGSTREDYQRSEKPIEGCGP